eukprot:TRINITY_DN6748_c0_g1_i3.p1 TRINITY_DN6748_c0_g1~~TRINITY_DN6748_c0_g1_i3.p1  ORF type:complete len:115 (+),score=7.81 TRINITY_DN6748_c0_g1_i3:67-411(+)
MLRWIRRLPTAFGQSKKLVGRDTNGNKYYNLTLQDRTARIVETPGDEEDYDPSNLPVEWRAWLSHKRDNIPTDEEIHQRLAYTARTLQRAQEIDEKEVCHNALQTRYKHVTNTL